MFYDGRPELALPPAPDTTGLKTARIALAAVTGFAMTLIAAAIGLSPSLGPAQGLLLAMAAVAVVLWIVLAIVCAALHDRHEARYWTPERVEQKCPGVWQVYRAGGPSRAAPPRVSRRNAPGAGR